MNLQLVELSTRMGIARASVYRWMGGGLISRKLAVRVCSRLGWNVMVAALIKGPEIAGKFDALLTPDTLMKAAKFHRPGMDLYHLQIVHAAASMLLINLQAKGVRATVLFGGSIGDKSAQVIIYHHNKVPRRSVLFSLGSGLLRYQLVMFTPGGQKTEAAGPATEDGFSFCLDFLNPKEIKTGHGKSPNIQEKLLDVSFGISGI